MYWFESARSALTRWDKTTKKIEKIKKMRKIKNVETKYKRKCINSVWIIICRGGDKGCAVFAR